MTDVPNPSVDKPEPAAESPPPAEPATSDDPVTQEAATEEAATQEAATPGPAAEEPVSGEAASQEAAEDTAAEAAAEESTEQPAGEDVDELAVTKAALAELTADLQRLQADFLNYKRRVERDRVLIEQNATFRVLTPIIEVLDTIDRAREHGDLDEGFMAVAEQLEAVVAKFGLTKFGEPGDPFDPNLHDALSHVGEDPEVEVTTCKTIVKAGYRIGDRVLRPAQVLVVDPPASTE